MKDLLQRRARRMKREVDDQQRRGETEDAVAECLHPVLAEYPAAARRVFVSRHFYRSFSWRGADLPMAGGAQPGGITTARHSVATLSAPYSYRGAA